MSKGLLLSLSLLTLAGCPSNPPNQCTQPFAGDPSQPIQAVVGIDQVTDGGASFVDVNPGDPVPMLPPPQGGFVVYAGVRAKNFNPCNAHLKGQLRDPQSGAIISDFDRRSTSFAPRGDGWWVPTMLDSFSTVPNIPACPDTSGAGVVDRDLSLELRLDDGDGRTITVSQTVKLVCPNDACQPECVCTCGPSYTPGKCQVDGGALRTDGGLACER